MCKLQKQNTTDFLRRALMSASQLVLCRVCSGRDSIAPRLGSCTTHTNKNTAKRPKAGVTWQRKRERETEAWRCYYKLLQVWISPQNETASLQMERDVLVDLPSKPSASLLHFYQLLIPLYSPDHWCMCGGGRETERINNWMASYCTVWQDL